MTSSANLQALIHPFSLSCRWPSPKKEKAHHWEVDRAVVWGPHVQGDRYVDHKSECSIGQSERLIEALALEPLQGLPASISSFRSSPLRAHSKNDEAQLCTGSSETDSDSGDYLLSSSDLSNSWTSEQSKYGPARETYDIKSTSNDNHAEQPDEKFPNEPILNVNCKSLPVVRKATKSPSFENEYFRISRSGIADWGARAVKDLQKGDIILQEEPILTADATELFHEFGKLDPRTREIALSLHANKLLKPGTPRIQAVWETNCFAISRHLSGLFPIAARFNHACHPAHSIEYKFDRELGRLRFTVKAEHIVAGEELTISYGADLTPSMLYLCYGFRCQCGACPGLSDLEMWEFSTVW